MRKFNYRHDDHDGNDEWLHQYADALLDHAWSSLLLRAMADSDFSHDENRAYVRTLIKRAIATSNTVEGVVETDNNVCLRFTLQHDYGPQPVTFFVEWSSIKGHLADLGLPLDI